MDVITSMIVRLIVYAGLIFLMSKYFEDFDVKPGGLVSITIILALAEFVLGWLLHVLALPVKFLTLGLFNIIISWLINVAVMKVTDKFSDSLTIRSTKTLLISGAALSVANWLIAILRSKAAS